jgi:peptide deformylase
MTAADTPRRLVLYGDRRLRATCRSPEPGEPGLDDLVRDMIGIMRRHRGVGLAAPQLGDDRRVIVVQPDLSGRRPPLVMIDPVLEESGGGPAAFEEGCLSFPGIYRWVVRPRAAVVRYRDPDGATRWLRDDGLAARVALHELDHLDGILLVDHLGPWRRFGVELRMGLRRLRRGGGRA